MKFSVFSKSVVGYKNEIKDKSSQDYLKFEKIKDGIICAIADGHSGDFFINSHIGSRLACEAAIETLKNYEDEDMNKMKDLLNNKTLQVQICNKWRELVKEDMKDSLPSVFRNNYFKYGTTLLIVMIKDNYIVYLRLGDGDILVKQGDSIKRVLPFYKKNVVDCLADEKAYEKMIYKIINLETNISTIIIYSDGFENSFDSYKSMVNEINETLIMYNKNIFTKMKIEKNYEKYLSGLSRNSSLDDISIIFVNIL